MDNNWTRGCLLRNACVCGFEVSNAIFLTFSTTQMVRAQSVKRIGTLFLIDWVFHSCLGFIGDRQTVSPFHLLNCPAPLGLGIRPERGIYSGVQNRVTRETFGVGVQRRKEHLDFDTTNTSSLLHSFAFSLSIVFLLMVYDSLFMTMVPRYKL